MFTKFPNFDFVMRLILLILSTSKGTQIRIKQTLFCEVNLTMFAPCALDCHVKPKRTSENAL